MCVCGRVLFLSGGRVGNATAAPYGRAAVTFTEGAAPAAAPPRGRRASGGSTAPPARGGGSRAPSQARPVVLNSPED